MTAIEDLTAIPFDELEATYQAHPKFCPCPECEEMDRRLGEMCIRPGCRNSSTPQGYTCTDHAAA